MIQESINQLLGTAAVAARMSPQWERSQEAFSAVGKAKAAESGLSDISSNLQNKNKQYTATELSDIENRVAGFNRDIYSAKVMSAKGHPNEKFAKIAGVGKLSPQSSYRDELLSIEKNLEKRKMALERMRSKGNTSIEQNNDFKRYLDSITGGNYGETND